jgi:hypothetical protein
MMTPDTKDGRLLVGTHWFPAGTTVVNVRLRAADVVVLLDALAVLSPDTEEGRKHRDDLIWLLNDCEPDVMNDFTL